MRGPLARFSRQGVWNLGGRGLSKLRGNPAPKISPSIGAGPKDAVVSRTPVRFSAAAHWTWNTRPARRFKSTAKATSKVGLGEHDYPAGGRVPSIGSGKYSLPWCAQDKRVVLRALSRIATGHRYGGFSERLDDYSRRESAAADWAACAVGEIGAAGAKQDKQLRSDVS